MTPALLAALERDCASSGVPVKVSDVVTIERLSALLRNDNGAVPEVLHASQHSAAALTITIPDQKDQTPNYQKDYRNGITS